ncbi:hypothetical protein AN960_16640 [Bacillus sp. FJAT-25509]|uniref:hypothetical protein n=1 Tax=Bacillus sp. FJAT-25509 TaxID=1712029 RepID=UPI0006FCE2C0|nr:hypothetical protein [Bacillus sp. FJAT-25509]KQL36249.1 hypothetical protein AN960_16640 [Bacillus sp. FJAT-25509]
MDVYKNVARIITDEDKAKIGIEKNKDGQLLTDRYRTMDSKGGGVIMEFYGTPNIDLIARKLIEIADSNIYNVKKQLGVEIKGTIFSDDKKLDINEKKFFMEFISFIEAKGWSFEGRITQVDKEVVFEE